MVRKDLQLTEEEEIKYRTWARKILTTNLMTASLFDEGVCPHLFEGIVKGMAAAFGSCFLDSKGIPDEVQVMSLADIKACVDLSQHLTQICMSELENILESISDEPRSSYRN